MSEDEFRAAVRTGSLSKAVAIAQQMMKSPSSFEIAVVGEPGAGKSSFINALRGVGDDDPGAAEVGVVETTQWATLYTHPKHPNVFLWDLPGIGMPHAPANENEQIVTCLTYDFFLIVSATRFRALHAALARQIQEKAKTFYFVRSKVDRDLKAEQRKVGYSEAGTLQQIREDCEAHLRAVGMNAPRVFLLSNWEPDKFDFPLLEETLDKELHRAMRQQLLTVSYRTLQEKKTALQKTTGHRATLSGGPTAHPLPGLSLVADLVLLAEYMTDYSRDFGLSPDSLAALAEQVGQQEEELKAEITAITTELVLELLTASAGGAMDYLSSIVCKIPMLGSAITAWVSHSTTVFMLDNFISSLAEDTQNVLAKALGGKRIYPSSISKKVIGLECTGGEGASSEGMRQLASPEPCPVPS